MHIRRTLLCLAIASTLAFNASLAQDEASFLEIAKTGLRLGIEYIATNGVIGSGYGISANSKEHGTLLSQTILVPELAFHVHKTEVTPGFEHGTLFNSKTDGNDYELVGGCLSFHWFKTPPWVPLPPASVTANAVVTSVKTLLPNLHDVYLKPSVLYRVDAISHGEVAIGNLFFGIEGGFKFGN